MGASDQFFLQQKSQSIRRELSVEDLFDPLNRLDVRPQQSQTLDPSCQQSQDPANPTLPSLHVELNQNFRNLPGTTGVERERFKELGHPISPSQFASTFTKASLHLSPWDKFGTGYHEKGAVIKSYEADRPRPSNFKGSGGSKSPVSGSDTGLQTQGNSTSDEDQQILDDRKQRRMLSNRESARRSRLRKQEHLDELRAHVAQLRAENSQMLSTFNLTSQKYAQLTEENSILRSEAMDLSHQLQRLHHAAQYSKGFRYGLDSGQGAQGPLRTESSPLPPLS